MNKQQHQFLGPRIFHTRNNSQCKLLKWLSVEHAPEYGIVSSSLPSSSLLLPSSSSLSPSLAVTATASATSASTAMTKTASTAAASSTSSTSISSTREIATATAAASSKTSPPTSFTTKTTRSSTRTTSKPSKQDSKQRIIAKYQGETAIDFSSSTSYATVARRKEYARETISGLSFDSGTRGTSGNLRHSETADNLRDSGNLGDSGDLRNFGNSGLEEVSHRVRHLTEEALWLIYGEIDDCARVALSYSMRGAVRCGRRFDSDYGVGRCGGRGRERYEKYELGEESEFWVPFRYFEDNVMSKHGVVKLVDEIHRFFDMFRPENDEDGEHETETEHECESECDDAGCGARNNIHGEFNVSGKGRESEAGREGCDKVTEVEEAFTVGTKEQTGAAWEEGLEAAAQADSGTATKADEAADTGGNGIERQAMEVEEESIVKGERQEGAEVEGAAAAGEGTSLTPGTNAETKTNAFDPTPFCDLRPTRYDPCIFPIIVVKCNFSSLDRSTITEGLVSDLRRSRCDDIWRTQRQQPHQVRTRWRENDRGTKRYPCVCTIRSNSKLVLQGQLMAEVLSQCIQNDPNGESFANFLRRQQKKRKSKDHFAYSAKGVLFKSVWNWTRSVVDWGRFTKAFDSIVVIMEDAEKIPSPTLDSFFTALSSLRSDHCIPVHLILMDAALSGFSGLGDRLSNLRGPGFFRAGGYSGGALLQEVSVPLPQVQFDIFMDRLFSGKCIPSWLWNNDQLFDSIREEFQMSNNSIAFVARELKRKIKMYFEEPGAFMSFLNCEQFTIPNWDRIAFLYYDKSARELMACANSTGRFHSSPEIRSKNDRYAFDLLWRIRMTLIHREFFQEVNRIFGVDPSMSFRKPSFLDVLKVNLKSCMYGLARLLQRVRTSLTRKVASDLAVNAAAMSYHISAVCRKLNEYIILVGHIAFSEQPELTNAKMLVEDIVEWVQCTFQWKQYRTCSIIPSSIHPRRDLSRALYFPPPIKSCPFAQARNIAFITFQSWSMLLSEWYEKYLEMVLGESRGVSALCVNETVFFTVVYELVLCGFFERKLTKSKREFYEKEVIVWANGRC